MIGRPARKNCANHTARHDQRSCRDRAASSAGRPPSGRARSAMMSPGNRSLLRLMGEQPGGDHREGRLEEFRRLQRQARQVNPAPRALDLDADDHGQRQQDREDDEGDDGDAPDAARATAARRRSSRQAGRQQRQDAGAGRSGRCRARCARRRPGSRPCSARAEADQDAPARRSVQRSTVHHQRPRIEWSVARESRSWRDCLPPDRDRDARDQRRGRCSPRASKFGTGPRRRRRATAARPRRCSPSRRAGACAAATAVSSVAATRIGHACRIKRVANCSGASPIR